MKNKKLIKTTLLLSSMFTVMAGAIIAPSLPQIEHVFKNTKNIAFLTRLILSVPAIFTVIFSPIFGIMANKFGKKQLLLMSLSLYAIGGFSGFILNNIYFILGGRALLGIAVAGIMTISSTLIGDFFTGAERNKFIGLQGAFMGFGGVVFVSLAGILADIKWNLPFLIYLLSIVVLLIGGISLYDLKKEIHSSESTLSKSDYKLEVAKVYIFFFIGVVFFYMMPVQLPFLLDKLENMTTSKIGFTISLMELSAAIVAFNYKTIKDFLSFDTIFILSLFFMGCGYVAIAYSVQYIFINVAVFIAGMGVGLLMPLGNLWIMQLAPANRRSIMVGNITTALFLGQFLSPILLQPIINSFGVMQLFLLAGFVMIFFVVILYLKKIAVKKQKKKILKNIKDFNDSKIHNIMITFLRK